MRPTKYNDDLLQSAREYVNNYADYDHAFPSQVGLADVLDICAKTLYNWANDESKIEFSQILEKIERKQQLVAWHKGLTGQYNSNLVKLLLGKHGYHDKQDNTLSGKDGGPILHKIEREIVEPSNKDR